MSLNFSEKFQKYRLIKEIGSGTFGRVWMAEDINNNELVAIKRRPKWQNMASREVEALETVKNKKNIVQIKNCFYSITPGGVIMQNIVMPLMSKSLGSYLREQRLLRKLNPAHRIPPELVKNISFQISEGLYALHSSGYTHRDFKPDNILLMNISDNNVKSEVIVKICDLGSSKKLNNPNANMPYVVSRFYRAPELLLGSCVYDEKIDIWALGCIFAELLTLDPIFVGRCPEKLRSRFNTNKQGLDEPFQILKIMEVLGNPSLEDIQSLNKMVPRSIKKAHNNLSFLKTEIDSLSWYEILEDFFTEDEKLLIELINSCIQWNPQKRPTAGEILESKYFKY